MLLYKLDPTHDLVRGGEKSRDDVATRVAAAASCGKPRRAVPPAGKHEAKHRKSGLHLWYFRRADKSADGSRRRRGRDAESPRRQTGAGSRYECDASAGRRFASAPERGRAAVAALERVGAFAKQDALGLAVLSVEVDRVTRGAAESDDPALSRQKADWEAIKLYQAWQIETGSPDLVVQVVDTGIDVDHPDLAQNIWVRGAARSGRGRGAAAAATWIFRGALAAATWIFRRGTGRAGTDRSVAAPRAGALCRSTRERYAITASTTTTTVSLTIARGRVRDVASTKRTANLVRDISLERRIAAAGLDVAQRRGARRRVDAAELDIASTPRD